MRFFLLSAFFVVSAGKSSCQSKHLNAKRFMSFSSHKKVHIRNASVDSSMLANQHDLVLNL